MKESKPKKSHLYIDIFINNKKMIPGNCILDELTSRNTINDLDGNLNSQLIL